MNTSEKALTKVEAPQRDTPRFETGEYLAPNKQVRIYKPDIHPIDKMIRVYSTQYATNWKLQVRGPLSIGCNGTRAGKSSVIAGVDLSLEQMISLRDALSEFISEAESARSEASNLSMVASDAVKTSTQH